MTVPSQVVHVDSPTEQRNPRTTEIDRMPTIGILRQINKEEQVSMLVVEQNAAMALDLADHAYVLETGHVVMSGPSAVVKNDENIRKSYLGY